MIHVAIATIWRNRLSAFAPTSVISCASVTGSQYTPVDSPAVWRAFEMMPTYTCFTGRVIDANVDEIEMRLGEANRTKVTVLRIPRRVCRNGHLIRIGDTEVQVADSWFKQRGVF